MNPRGEIAPNLAAQCKLASILNTVYNVPVVLKIDIRRRLVYSTFYGKITDDELLNHRSTIAADPHFNRDFNEIVDFSAVTEPNISEAGLAQVAAGESLYSDSVLHIVVAPADLAFQLASQFKTFAHETRHNLLVVRSRDEAYKLLGIEHE